MPTRQEAIRELFKRDALNPDQRAAVEELSRRGQFNLDAPQQSEPDRTITDIKPPETVLPSGVSQDDFDRITRTGLTPGTAVQHAGVSIATENERRRVAGTPELSSKQQEARLRVFQQEAGTPGSEIVDQFAKQQAQQRTQRSTTLGGRLQSAGVGALSTIGATGTDVIGLFAPETARSLSEEFRTLLNPDGSRAGKAGALLGELAKVTTFARTGPAGLALIFGAQGAGGVRQEVAGLRAEGQEISGLQEAGTASLVGGVEAASGFISGKIFGSLGKTLAKVSPITRTGLMRGEAGAVRKIVKSGLSTTRDLLAEGADEGLTQLITNKIRQGIKPEIAITEGVLEAAATGVLLAPFGAAGIQGSGTSQQTEQAPTLTDVPGIEPGREATEATLEEQAIKTQEVAQVDNVPAQVDNVPAQVDNTPAQVDNSGAITPSQLQQQIQDGPSTITPSQLQEQVKATDNGVTIPQDVAPVEVDVEGTPQQQETPKQTINRTAGQVSPEGTTSARRVDVDANREAMNNVLLEQADTQTWEAAQVKAQEQDIPNRAMQLARGIQVAPRAFSDVETAGMVQRQIALIAEHSDMQDQVDAADDIDAKLIDAELRRIEDDHAQLSSALAISGTEKGRALNSQKLTLNQKFELVSILGRAKRAKGKDLTPSERARITSLTRDIKRLEKRLENLKNKDESKSPVLNKVRNQQIDKLIFERAQLQARINRVIDNIKPRSWAEIAVREPLSIARALKSSFDVSAVGRQAGLASLGNPARAIRNMGPMFRALASERAQFEISEKIKNHPKFELAKRAGVRLVDTSVGAQLDQKEENYRSRFADHIPGVRASDRAFSTFLNLMRMDGFDVMTDSLARRGEPTWADTVAMADTVNNFTGFGGLADMKKSSKILNTVFWSPSLQLARIQLLTARPASVITGRSKAGKLSPAARRAIAAEYGKTLLGFTTLMALGVLSGGEMETDPRSSDFMKLKFGNTRIDLGSGIFQYVVLASRLGAGQTKSPISGKIRDTRGDDKKFGSPSGLDIGARFVASKFTPGLSLGLNVLFGQNVVGETVEVKTVKGVKNVVIDGIMPLSMVEMAESFKEQGVPGGVALSVMTLFGEGIQNFTRKPKKTKSRRKSRGRRRPTR